MSSPRSIFLMEGEQRVLFSDQYGDRRSPGLWRCESDIDWKHSRAYRGAEYCEGGSSAGKTVFLRYSERRFEL